MVISDGLRLLSWELHRIQQHSQENVFGFMFPHSNKLAAVKRTPVDQSAKRPLE